jgi:hypothetical protein
MTLALWEKEGRVGVTGLDGTGETLERATDFLSEEELDRCVYLLMTMKTNLVSLTS